MSLCGSSIELNNAANIAIITIHSTANLNRAKKDLIDNIDYNLVFTTCPAPIVQTSPYPEDYRSQRLIKRITSQGEAILCKFGVPVFLAPGSIQDLKQHREKATTMQSIHQGHQTGNAPGWGTPLRTREHYDINSNNGLKLRELPLQDKSWIKVGKKNHLQTPCRIAFLAWSCPSGSGSTWAVPSSSWSSWISIANFRMKDASSHIPAASS